MLIDESDLDKKLEDAHSQGERMGVVYGFMAAVVGLVLSRLLGFI